MCSKDAQYPAPGVRHRDTGEPMGVGNDGYSSSSSVNGTNGLYLGFFTQNLYSSRAYSCAHGIQLRCLSE